MTLQTSPLRLSRVSPILAAFLLAVAACAGRQASVESEPEPLTAEDYYGTYDLYMGGMPITPGEPAPMTAEWTDREFVVLQGGNPTIRTEIAIDPAEGEIRIWDERTSDVLCASEGIYAYEDDGETITLELLSDPCADRAESADGARLVRREDAAG